MERIPGKYQKTYATCTIKVSVLPERSADSWYDQVFEGLCYGVCLPGMLLP